MSPHAFVDESARGGRYILCTTLVDARDLDEVRKLARSLCLRGQRRWHFKSESNRRQHKILDSLVRTKAIRGFIYTGTGRDMAVRGECLTALITDLIDHKASRLVIESRESMNGFDRQCILEALRKTSGTLDYLHLRPHEEPGLWLPDAIAWAYGAGGEWRRRVRPTLTVVRDVGIVP